MHTVSAHGAAIPALGYGTWKVTGADCVRMVSAVLDLGWRHIDTAQLYGNEAEVGEGLRRSSIPRADIFLTTKVWPDRYRRLAFHQSVDESLEKLKTPYVDLLLLHWPNDAVPLEEQIGTLNEVHAAGKARYIGVSNFNIELMRKAAALSKAPLVTNQVEYQPFLDQDAVIAEARRLGLSLTAYYAMASGRIFQAPLLAGIAAAHGRTVAQVVLRWLVQQDGVIALSKTLSEDRAQENMAIFDFELTGEEMAAIHDLSHPNGRMISPTGLAPDWD